MNETVKIWLRDLYTTAIGGARASIKNEHLWELGCPFGQESNPHTENIKILEEYIEVLQDKLAEVTE